jgi:peroxiredoxin
MTATRWTARLCFSLLAVLMLALAMGADDGAPTKAPDFSLQDQNGKKVSLADFADKVVVLEWFNPECPFVVRHHEKQKTMTKLAEKYAPQGVVWLAIDSSKTHNVEINKKNAEAWKIGYPVLDDSKGEVGKAYSAKTTPHMFVINKGQIVYQGAIDDDPQGSKGDQAVNYVAKALDETLAGQTVTTAKTKPYGCSVKY